MPILKYVKVLLLTPALGSVLICFVGLSLGAILISTWGRSQHGTVVNSIRPIAASGSAPIASSGSISSNFNFAHDREALRTQQPTTLTAASHPSLTHGAHPNADGRSSRPHLDRAIFQKPIASDQLGFLTGYAGRPANDVVREQELRRLVDKVVPYAPFHLGLDMPLPHAIESMFSSSPAPVEIRDGRYVMVSGRRGANARGRGFIWIDMQGGIAIGGIFFYPSNGEPTPTLTLFSKQVKQDSLGMKQLPLAFAQDFSRWVATAGVPPITTRYFINASNDKILLAHDEDFCKSAAGAPAPGKDVCKQMNADAADIDMKATHFLKQTQYASNATMREIVDRSPVTGSSLP